MTGRLSRTGTLLAGLCVPWIAYASPPEVRAPDATASTPAPPLSFREGLASPGAAATPLVKRDRIMRVIERAPGDAWVVGRKHLYEYRSQSGDAMSDEPGWTVHPYPRDANVSWGEVGLGGELYVMGESGALFRFTDGNRFDRQVVAGVGSDTHRTTWERGYFSADTSVLWIQAGKDRLLAVHLPDGETRQHRVPVPGHGSQGVGSAPVHLAGRRWEERDQLILTMGRGLYLFDHGMFRSFGEQPGTIEGLAFVDGELAAIVTTAQGQQRVQLASTPSPGAAVELTPAQQRAVEAAGRREAFLVAQRNHPAHEIEWFPTARVVPGVNMALTAPPAGLSRASFGMEVDAGIIITPPYDRREGREMRPGSWYWPQIGYQWMQRPGAGHGVSAGAGFGYGSDFFAMFYTPRGVLGGLGGSRLRPGLRHGVSAQGFWGTLGLEVSHGVDFDGGRAAHDLRISLGINLVMVIFASARWASL